MFSLTPARRTCVGAFEQRRRHRNLNTYHIEIEAAAQPQDACAANSNLFLHRSSRVSID